jgi:hypothetical protein
MVVALQNRKNFLRLAPGTVKFWQPPAEPGVENYLKEINSGSR